MRRALILIITLSVLTAGLGLWADFSQRALAWRYLDEVAALRNLLLAGQPQQAAREHAYVYARWEGDAKRLNLLISHHHTRAVTTAMTELATALEQSWTDEALRALDRLGDALGDIAASDFPYLENIL